MSIPVILLGKTTTIGATVAKHLAPEYEVIRFIQSLSTAQSEIPHILCKRAPPTSTPTTTVADDGTAAIGSNDFSRGARAIIFGRAWTLSQVEELRSHTLSLINRQGQEDVAWVVGDPDIDMSSKPALGAGYAENAVAELKEVLQRDSSRKGGIVLY